MYSPINKIEFDDYLDKKSIKFFSFSQHIKDKYQLNSDTLKILDLITFEELLALKMEKSVDIFNGKFLLPFKEIYQDYINKAMFLLISAYDDPKLKKKIRSLLVLNRRSKLRVHDLYRKYSFNMEYNKEK